jgi:hypothetical protein
MHCFVSVHCIVMQRSTRDINIVGNRTSKSCGFTSAICCFLYLLNKIEFGDIINKSLWSQGVCCYSGPITIEVFCSSVSVNLILFLSYLFSFHVFRFFLVYALFFIDVFAVGT